MNDISTDLTDLSLSIEDGHYSALVDLLYFYQERVIALEVENQQLRDMLEGGGLLHAD